MEADVARGAAVRDALLERDVHLEALARDTHKSESRYLDRLLGQWPEAHELYRARSSIHHVDRLSGPIVFLQGLEDAVVAGPSPARLRRIFELKRVVVQLRKIVSPQREVYNSLSRRDYPHIDPRVAVYFRDVYDHLVRAFEVVDAYRDLISNTLDAYLAVVSNRLGQVMKQLTIITTIFMPLSFLTGFFGMNFPWLVGHVGGAWWFVGLGLGAQLITLLLLLSVLAGIYVGLPWIACGWRTAGTGGIVGFLGIACPVCNKILVLLFGSALLLQYYEPVRLYLAAGGVVLLAVAIWLKVTRSGYVEAGKPGAGDANP